MDSLFKRRVDNNDNNNIECVIKILMCNVILIIIIIINVKDGDGMAWKFIFLLHVVILHFVIGLFFSDQLRIKFIF